MHTSSHSAKNKAKNISPNNNSSKIGFLSLETQIIGKILRNISSLITLRPMESLELEENEVKELLCSDNGPRIDSNVNINRTGRSSRAAPGLTPANAAYKIIAILAILTTIGFIANSSSSTRTNNGVEVSDHRTRAKSTSTEIPQFSCPKDDDIAKSLNDLAEEDLDTFYEKKNGTSALTLQEIEKLKEEGFDGWRRDYETFKETKRKMVSQMFKSLRPGDSLFEVACGIGFNLLMTVEILKEIGIEDINVYGIDYVQSSVDLANQILEISLPPIKSNLGSPICRGDASNLFFVEDESFDMVFTGYIDPITDPLGMESELGREPEIEDFCDGKKGDWEKKMLAKLDQKKQEDWYSSWVVEMIRIAKKGAPIIVEEISLPFCEDPNDWGGVSKKWWTEAISTYDWDVDVDSMVFDDSRSRYTVFMRKND